MASLSAQSVTLMSQLRFLEDSIVAIIVEFSQRLASLSDLGIFIMLEGAEGRRLAGTPRLIETFKSEGLTSTEADLHVELRPQDSLVPAGTMSETSGSNAGTKKRRWSSTKTTPSKKRRQTTCDGDVKPFADGALELDGEGSGVDGDNTICKTEEIDESEYAIDLNLLQLDETKMEFLRNITDPEAVFVKGSPDFKVITSTFSELGTELARHCTHPADSPYLHVNFARFLDSIPIFRDIDKLLPNLRLNAHRPSAYLLKGTRKAFTRAAMKTDSSEF